jgi:hypothetical protein
LSGNARGLDRFEWNAEIMKRKLTAAEKRRRRERKAKTMIIFVNGKQKRIRRPPSVDGVPVDDFIARNADPIWLHQNDMWEEVPEFHTDPIDEENS